LHETITIVVVKLVLTGFLSNVDRAVAIEALIRASCGLIFEREVIEKVERVALKTIVNIKLVSYVITD